MKIEKSTIELLKRFEGCKLEAYQLKNDKPTIGFGHTGSEVHLGMKITMAQAEKYLAEDLKERQDFINKHVPCELNQNEFDALISFLYNRGSGNFIKTRLYSLLKTGNKKDIANAFLDDENWNFTKYSRGIRASLYKRRRIEREIFMKN